MTFIKRMFLTLSAFIVLVLGSFSFMSAGALSSPSFNYEPFYVAMPQLPDGYFDGDILASDSGYSISLDFSNLSSDYSGSSSSSGSAQSQGNVDESITFPVYNTRTNDAWSWSSGSIYYEDYDAYAVPGSYDNAQSPNAPWDAIAQGNPSGTITGSSVSTPNGGGSITGYGDDYIYNESGSESGSSDFSGTVTGSITSNGNKSDDHHRFRTFSLVRGASSFSDLYWFVVDARNVIYSYVDNGVLKVRFSGGYPSVVYRFNLDGSFHSSSANVNLGFPAVNGLWFSNSFPLPSSGMDNIVLRDAVFGKEALLFSYLHLIESDLNTIHSDLTSLNSSMQSSITNQTNIMMNADAASGFDPTSVSNMLEYGSLESTFNAPSTNDLFSLSGGSYTDGMGFWRDRMNEVLFFNGSPILPMTIFSLTLGLAVLVIGRRVSGGGTA